MIPMNVSDHRRVDRRGLAKASPTNRIVPRVAMVAWAMPMFAPSRSGQGNSPGAEKIITTPE